MIVSLDIDAQKTFTPLCPNELPIIGGDEIVSELNAQAAFANARVMSKDAHSPTAHWLCSTPEQQLHATGLPDAPEYWLSHAIVGTYGFELLDGLPAETDYDFCVWKGVAPHLHPYGACYHDVREHLSTGLIEWLTVRATHTVIVGGLATDYCVKATVLQLLRGGNWQVLVNQAACRGIHAKTVENAWLEMAAAGAIICRDAVAVGQYLSGSSATKKLPETR